MNDDLSVFPYINGGLFADENIEIPRFTDEIVDLLVNGASKVFNWAEISPTIFGAVFESTLNPDTRRFGGIYYTSIENMAWVCTVCGRLKSNYSYSNTVVYNNFLFPNPTTEQGQRIERTARAILDARNLYPTFVTLADLYDELTMPPELRKAHQKNDLA